MTIQISAVAVLLLSVPVFADEAAERTKLLGTWQAQNSAGNAVVWVLEGKGSKLYIMESVANQKTSEFECEAFGSECEGMSAGKKGKVTMYFNGAALVQLQTRGSDVTKRRFSIVADPDTMDVEVAPMAGGGKAETLHLKRVQTSAGSR